ncbi:type II secretion system F family protein [Microbacterium sp. YY-03]|uniref:type II secretion system F family protein n=1 Tax=Microbacterium sp. YY-03 TaxID=3421636 RepID=UPI003D1707B9
MNPVLNVAIAVLMGGMLGLGLWSLLSVIPRWGAEPLVRRVAPYVRDVTDQQGTSLPLVAPTDPAAFIARGLRRLWGAVVGVVSRVWGVSDALTARLARAGWRLTAAQYRERQLGAALGAALVGALLAVVARVAGNSSPAVLILPVLAAMAGGMAVEFTLSRAVTRRRARIDDELPTVLEFLALCLSAGEGLLDAIRRTANVGVGDLSAELRGVVLSVGTGAPLADALAAFSARVDVPGVQRAVDHLVAALERGAPLAAVLKDQAADARDDHKRALLEKAGQNEVLMLVPLVFLILPLSVAIAVFPGIALLGNGFQ